MDQTQHNPKTSLATSKESRLNSNQMSRSNLTFTPPSVSKHSMTDTLTSFLPTKSAHMSLS